MRPLTATRFSWSVVRTRVNATLYDEAQFQFHPRYRAGRGHCPRALMSWWSIHPFRPKRFLSSSPMPKPIRARSTWRSAGNGTRNSCRRRAVQDDGRRQLVHVPYRGADLHLQTCSADKCRSSSPSVASSVEYIRAGKLRASRGNDATRSEVLPDLPTVGEFVPGYEISAWFGVGAPQGTPAEIIDKLNKEINCRPCRSQDEGAACRLCGCADANDAADFGKLIADETEKWGKVIRAANIKAE